MMFLALVIALEIAEAVPTDPVLWSEIFKNAASLGLGGILLAAIAWYFQRDNKALLAELKIERTERSSRVDKELAECRADRTEQQKQILGLKDQIIEVYKTRPMRTMAGFTTPEDAQRQIWAPGDKK